MTTTTLTLTAFLLARLGEEEAAARLSMSERYGTEAAPHLLGCGLNSYNVDSCDCGYPARVLADCAAKRAIVGLMVDPDIDERGIPWGSGGYGEAYGDTLRHLAAVYSDHADYDPSWAVS